MSPGMKSAASDNIPSDFSIHSLCLIFRRCHSNSGIFESSSAFQWDHPQYLLGWIIKGLEYPCGVCWSVEVQPKPINISNVVVHSFSSSSISSWLSAIKVLKIWMRKLWIRYKHRYRVWLRPFCGYIFDVHGIADTQSLSKAVPWKAIGTYISADFFKIM